VYPNKQKFRPGKKTSVSPVVQWGKPKCVQLGDPHLERRKRRSRRKGKKKKRRRERGGRSRRSRVMVQKSKSDLLFPMRK